LQRSGLKDDGTTILENIGFIYPWTQHNIVEDLEF